MLRERTTLLILDAYFLLYLALLLKIGYDRVKLTLRKKSIKKLKRRIPWIEHIINEKNAGDLNLESPSPKLQTERRSLCLICRGVRGLCGRNRCPAILKLYSFMKTRNAVSSNEMIGSSPPGVFVGRIGYPYVYAGPLVPPFIGDTSLFDLPEQWLGKTDEEIIKFRISLIRGKFKVNVKKPWRNKNFLDKTLEIALSRNPVDTEVIFRKKPSGRILLDGTLQPMGPSAVLEQMKIGSFKTDFRIEKAYSDEDLRSEEAIFNLYLSGIPVSRIQRAFSVGAFGLKSQRRLVPTRWSITAVDSMISRKLIEEKVKKNNPINEYRVYEFNYLGNRFIVFLMPSSWRYEWIEAWYPKTIWNLNGSSIAMGGDWEGYKGRNTYASLGGCYYAVRLAVAEFLAKEKRQAGVVAMREIHPSFITPLGVWINRESVREALKRKSVKFNNLRGVIDYISRRFSIGIDEWIKTSTLLKEALYQEKITKYF